MTHLDRAHSLALELRKALDASAREGQAAWMADVPLREVINAIELEHDKCKNFHCT